MHKTIQRMTEIVSSGEEDDILTILAEHVTFLPPTYYSSWVGPNAVAAVLGHVGHVFTDFSYRRILGEGNDWALEFSCKVGDLDGVGVDLITLDSDGLISKIEVVMRPHKTVGALRDAMNMRVMRDPRFLEFQKALT